MARLPEGSVDRQDEVTFMQVMAMIKAANGGTWVAGPPVWLQKAMAAVLGPIAERTGRGVVGPSGA